MVDAYNQVLETEEDQSPNIFNMKNQVIHEVSYNEEYTARESAIKKDIVNSDEKCNYIDEDEDDRHFGEY